MFPFIAVFREYKTGGIGCKWVKYFLTINLLKKLEFYDENEKVRINRRAWDFQDFKMSGEDQAGDGTLVTFM